MQLQLVQISQIAALAVTSNDSMWECCYKGDETVDWQVPVLGCARLAGTRRRQHSNMSWPAQSECTAGQIGSPSAPIPNSPLMTIGWHARSPRPSLGVVGPLRPAVHTSLGVRWAWRRHKRQITAIMFDSPCSYYRSGYMHSCPQDGASSLACRICIKPSVQLFETP